MNSEIKLLGIVITYFPDMDVTSHNICSYLDEVDELIVWENTPLIEREKYRINFPINSKKVTYMGVNDNVCIAHPLNKAIEYGLQNHFTHLLMMDQDSCFELNHFKRYKEIIKKNKDICFIFGSNPNYLYQPPTDKPKRVKTLITSSTVIDLKIISKIGFFREDYKIDCVDYEFCFRAAQLGFFSYMINSVLLHQEFGKLHKTVLGYYTSNYPPFRLYYITKNNIKLRREYPGFIGNREMLSRILKPTFKILLHEDNKIQKFKAIFRGVIDGLLKKDLVSF